MGGGEITLRTVQAFLDKLEARDQGLKVRRRRPGAPCRVHPRHARATSSQLLQYGSRMVMWYLLQADPKSDLGIRCEGALWGAIGGA